jgi:hypothetical protein
MIAACGDGGSSEGSVDRSSGPSDSVASSAASGNDKQNSAAVKHFERSGGLPGNLSNVWGDDQIIVAVQDGAGPTQFRSFTSSGNPLASYTDSDSSINVACGIRVYADNAGRSQLLTLRESRKPAEGVNPELATISMTKWDPKTLKKVWETQLATEEQTTSRTPICSSGDAEPAIEVSTDGKWATVANIAHVGKDSYIVATSTGKPRTVSYSPAPVGPNIGAFDGLCASCVDLIRLKSLRIVDPEDDATIATINGRAASGEPPTELDMVVDSVNWPRKAAVFDRGLKLAVNSGGQPAVLDLSGLKVVRRYQLDNHDLYAGLTVAERDNRLYAETNSMVPTSSLTGFDLSSGAKVWTQSHVDNLCAAGNGQVAVEANGQIALLDASSGKQIDHTTSLTTCGDVFGNYSLNRKTGDVYRLID